MKVGPRGFHVLDRSPNPKIINDRRTNAAGTGRCDPCRAVAACSLPSSAAVRLHGNHFVAVHPIICTYDSALRPVRVHAVLRCPSEFLTSGLRLREVRAEGNYSIRACPTAPTRSPSSISGTTYASTGLVTNVTSTATRNQSHLHPVAHESIHSYLSRSELHGIPDRVCAGNDLEPGAPLRPILIRYRDGSIGFHKRH